MIFDSGNNNDVTRKHFRKQIEDIIMKGSNVDLKLGLMFDTNSGLDKSKVNRKIDDLTSLLFGSNETVTLEVATSFLNEFRPKNPYTVPYDPLANKDLALRWITLTDGTPTQYRFSLSEDILFVAETSIVYLDYYIRDPLWDYKLWYKIKVDPDIKSYTVSKTGEIIKVVLNLKEYSIRYDIWKRDVTQNPGKCYQYLYGEVKELVLSKLDGFGNPVNVLPITYDNLMLL